MTKRWLATWMVIVSIGAARPARATWPSRGLPVMVQPGFPALVVAVPDGSGGAIVIDRDSRLSSNYDLFAQRIDRAGNALWPNDTPVCTAPGVEDYMSAASDGAGGAIVVWSDDRSGSSWALYAQRIAADGSPQWATDGIELRLGGGRALVVPSGTGGAVVALATTIGMRVQRLDASGAALWGSDGVFAASFKLNGPGALVADGQGGFVVASQTEVSGQSGDWLQRLDADGQRLWSTNGVLTAPTPEPEDPTVAPDGAGGAIMVWSDYRNGTPFVIGRDLFAQHVDGSGALTWDPDGVPVAVAQYSQYQPKSLSDGAGGAIVAWVDQRDADHYSTRIWGQHIAADGSMLWAAGGISLSPFVDVVDSDQGGLRLVPGESGDAIAVWLDIDPYTGQYLAAQRVDADGNTYWGQEGIRFYDGYQSLTPPVVAAGDGHVIAFTVDKQFADYDVFAQRIDLVHGEWGAPEPLSVSVADNPRDQGGQVVVSWDASQLDARPQRVIAQYTVWRSPPGAGSWQVVGAAPARYSAHYSLLVPTPEDSSTGDPAVYDWRVLSHGVDSLTHWASETATGYSVDNLGPGMPTELVAKRSASGVNLTWTAPGDGDVVEYRVYRASSAGGATELAPVGTASATSFVDAQAPVADLIYAVAALDRAGNEGSWSDEIAVSGDAGRAPPPIDRFGVLPNSPNPFAGGTTFRIGMPRAGDVRVEIFDVAGRRVVSPRTVTFPAGWQMMTFDGRDERGRLLPNGIYFLRARTGQETVTRKMVIAR